MIQQMKQYYNDYFKSNNIEYKKGKYNIVTLPCGSGKTFHCLDFITLKREYEKRFGRESHLARCLYVTDTSALKESVIHAYQNKTGKRVESTKNIEVITYAKLAIMISQIGGDYLATRYDYIFLDEIHQLFLYSERYDSRADEESEYQNIIDSLALMVDKTTLICLSATPKPLIEYLDDVKESNKIYHVIPATDIHKIKAYTTTHTIPVFDTQSIIENIELGEHDKMFIFATTITELKNLEEICQDKGYSTLALWSIRYNQMHSDDVIDEMKLAKNRMTSYQLEARERLLKTGEYSEQVILLNGAYESGINIENGKDSEQRTVHVVVCNSCEYAITQSRGRVRHDIDCLYYLSHDWYDSEGKGAESNKALVNRLDQLVSMCEEDECRFQGKSGLNLIADTLTIWISKIDKHGKNRGRTQAKSVKSINSHLLLLELPYEIQQDTFQKKVNNKNTRFTYYTVINTEVQADDEIDYTSTNISTATTLERFRRR